MLCSFEHTEPLSTMSSKLGRTVSKEQSDMSLQMDFWSDQLSEAQKAFYSKAEKEYDDIMAKVSDFITNEKGSVVEHGSEVIVLQGRAGQAPPVSVLNTIVTQPGGGLPKGRLIPIHPPPTQQIPVLQTVPSQQLVIQGGTVPSGARVTRTTQASTQSTSTFQTPQGTIQLVMDSRLGFLVGATLSNPSGQGNQIAKPPVAPVVQTSVSQQPVPMKPSPVSSAPVQSTTAKVRTTSVVKTTTNTTPSSQAKGSVPSTTTKQNESNTQISSNKPAKVRSSTGFAQTSIPASVNRPTEHSSVGGLCAGTSASKNAKEEGKIITTGPDSKEVTFNKLSGKTYPSLVVLARPHLRMKDMTPSQISQERVSLDSKVKCVLMYTSTKFSEWLIQEGLVRSDQFCSMHRSKSGPLKLKLGMYSDASKFPFSGGYVWVSECCPQKFVSLFSGSIFESAPHPPSILLKLIYHWCCQTNVQNVIQWVKVDNLYVKNFFTQMRSVCVAAVHDKHEKLGGPQKKIEVGVISLGTTSQDGNMRQVKVEVLGVMDVENKLVRLRAVEPLQEGEKNYKRRFVKILEPLKNWVHPESIVLTDFTVDKGTLLGMGFTQVHQSTIPDPPTSASKLSNQNIMEYLRRIVPRMFQNTLSLLSRQIIQQFLDELVWRERWGAVPSQAFEYMISHLAAQTKLDTGESLIGKLNKIASNPFRDWAYIHWPYDGLVPVESPFESTSTSQQTLTKSIPTFHQPSSQSSSTSHPTSSNLLTTAKIKVSEALSRMPFEEECLPSIALTKRYEPKLTREVENQVLLAVQNIEKGLSLRTAIRLSKVPRSLVLVRARDALRSKPALGSAVFTEDEEADLQEHLMTLNDWGFPFGRWDIRLIVKQYLDICGRIEHRFKDNYPGDTWIERFLSRHPLVKDKLCRNIPSRSNSVDSEAVKQYILNLSSVIAPISSSNILNFMEIGLTGDPLKSMAVEFRELRYPVGKRKVKSAAAVMISSTAEGKVLPSYVVFEGKTITIKDGKHAGEYYGSKTGWFDDTAFQYWLESVVFPWADNLPGTKVLVGDNLAQLFSLKTLALCVDKNIAFVCMPCNVAGLLSPLDVILYEKLRTQWRVRTRAWAAENGDKYITIEEFPSHIFELLSLTFGRDMPALLRNAFKQVGLSPFNTRNMMKVLETNGISMNVFDQNQSNVLNVGKITGGKPDSDGPSLMKQTKEALVEVVLDDEDIEKDMAAIEEALKYSDDLVKLEPYYYGIKMPSPHVPHETKVENLQVKCPQCRTIVADNITLMKHLMGHSEKQPTVEEISSIILCRYCATTFSTEEGLQKHLKQVHLGLSSQDNACLICSEKMKSREALVYHMHSVHGKWELPYVCTICYYCCSEQYKLVDHFYGNHAGGEKIQCPFCLKCVSVSCAGKKMAANVILFMHHVKKHQTNNSSRKCQKCTLWFVHRGILKDHMMHAHVSNRHDSNILPYEDNSEDSVMMPLPDENKEQWNFSRVSLSNITLRGLLPPSWCKECHLNIKEQKHFVYFMSCKQCSFSTCCPVSMEKHFSSFHGRDRLASISKLPTSLLNPENMYCVCGFKTQDGNVLAKHLVHCVTGSTSAYLTLSAAKAASDACGSQFHPPISFQKLDQTTLPNDLVPINKNSLGGVTGKLLLPVETEDECNRERPSSRGSSSSSSSNKRKRSGLDDERTSNEIRMKAPKNDITLD